LLVSGLLDALRLLSLLLLALLVLHGWIVIFVVESVLVAASSTNSCNNNNGSEQASKRLDAPIDQLVIGLRNRIQLVEATAIAIRRCY